MSNYSYGVKATLTKEQYEILLKYVEENETTISQVIRLALKKFLEKNQ